MDLENRPRAKINLALAVAGVRADGYHELSSVFLRVGLSDRLSVRPADRAGGHDTLTVTGSTDLAVEGNLVLRAVGSLRAEVGAPLPPLDLELEKLIPLAAGLGGGSADAAAALGLAAAIWGVGLSPARERVLARSLGADVPFFMSGQAAALAQGIGERIEPLPGIRGDVGLLLVTPALRLSTPEVFRAYDSLGPSVSRAAASVADLARALRDGLDGRALADWTNRLAPANDLWPAALALEPRLGGIRGALEAALGRPVVMTGSGSTLVALYHSGDEASIVGQRLAAGLPEALVGSSILACDPIGPDPIWRYP